uniref:Uncharacterized protein AlNc14C7G916 n=1 Tax=Albugo laibachii Nc14 TaxID=890382 RepID=F0W1E7_9STRA|nr:conserved hypothetical protein [Albugo laibachii Nc14]|eukprot:CCA14876.1 conserved hypothetical protein [Albugo laibachii Nc14]
MELSDSLIRVPYEQINKSFRLVQKQLTKQLLNFLQRLAENRNSLQSEDTDRQYTLMSLLDAFEDQVVLMRDTLHQHSKEQEKSIDCCIQRLHYLEVLQKELVKEKDVNYADFELFISGDGTKESTSQISDPEQSITKSQSLLNYRLITDYMLCCGYMESADVLRTTKDIKHLVDYEIHIELQGILRDLQSCKLTNAINWCLANGSRLRRLNPPCMMTFQLRMQEFIELVRIKDKLKAIEYAQELLTPLVFLQEDKVKREVATRELQEAMATLAYEDVEKCGIDSYRELFSLKRWQLLRENFRKTFWRVYGMSDPPLLFVALHSGLSSLNTRTCKQIRRDRARQALEVMQKEEKKQKRHRLKSKHTNSPANSKNSVEKEYGPRSLARTENGGSCDDRLEETGNGGFEDALSLYEYCPSSKRNRERRLMRKLKDTAIKKKEKKRTWRLHASEDRFTNVSLRRLMKSGTTKIDLIRKVKCEGIARTRNSSKNTRHDILARSFASIPDCPTCSDIGGKLCESIPLALRPHSRLICRITGTVMNEHNPPIVLPNGYVYSHNAITRLMISGDRKMLSSTKDTTKKWSELPTGKIICVETNQEYLLSELRPVYIL